MFQPKWRLPWLSASINERGSSTVARKGKSSSAWALGSSTCFFGWSLFVPNLVAACLCLTSVTLPCAKPTQLHKAATICWCCTLCQTHAGWLVSSMKYAQRKCQKSVWGSDYVELMSHLMICFPPRFYLFPLFCVISCWDVVWCQECFKHFTVANGSTRLQGQAGAKFHYPVFETASVTYEAMWLNFATTFSPFLKTLIYGLFFSYKKVELASD